MLENLVKRSLMHNCPGAGDMSYYYLEVLRGSEVGRRYLLADGATSVGRSSQNTLALHSAEKSVSGHHAIIYKSGDRISLQDLESTNGTFVNEEQDKRAASLPRATSWGSARPGRGSGSSHPTRSFPSNAGKAQMASAESTSIRTVEDELQAFGNREAPEGTGKEDLELITKVRLRMPKAGAGFSGPSATMDMEKKILENKLGESDMRHLMRDGKRLDRIIDRGNIGTAQASMLRTVHTARTRSRTNGGYSFWGA